MGAVPLAKSGRVPALGRDDRHLGALASAVQAW